MGDGSFNVNRRGFLKLGAMASVAGIALAACNPFSRDPQASSEPQLSSDPQGPPAPTPNARFIVDVHAHAGMSPGMTAAGEQINSAAEWGAFRTSDPVRFVEITSEDQIDNTDALIKTMDEHGVTHALIQSAPGRDATNKKVADMARRHPGRFWPMYRPDFAMGPLAEGTLADNLDKAVLSRNARRIAEDIESMFPELGLIGVAEVVPYGVWSVAIDPIEISRDSGPIMEALGPRNLPIQLPTGFTGWKDTLHSTWSPIWIDSLAANFPDVPMVLVKMGRGYRTSFDACLVIAVRNANVYLEMTDAHPEHLREAAQAIGPERIMFGTDLSGISVNYTYEDGFRILHETKLNAEELEWIAWRTANKVYRLGLE